MVDDQVRTPVVMLSQKSFSNGMKDVNSIRKQLSNMNSDSSCVILDHGPNLNQEESKEINSHQIRKSINKKQKT